MLFGRLDRTCTRFERVVGEAVGVGGGARASQELHVGLEASSDGAIEVARFAGGEGAAVDGGADSTGAGEAEVCSRCAGCSAFAFRNGGLPGYPEFSRERLIELLVSSISDGQQVILDGLTGRFEPRSRLTCGGFG